MKHIVNKRPYLYLELAVLMLGLPALLATFIPVHYMLPVLWGAALYCHLIYRVVVDVPDRIYWRWNYVNAKQLKPILIRWVLLTALTVALTLALAPELFLSFVKTRPLFWLLVMIFYPIVSVIPQEIIFRTFFFQRYDTLFTTPIVMVLASGILFGAAHLIFQNWIAPALCVIGGVIFAMTYQKTKSLALVSIEHALYGCMVFTVGLGRYFYHGAIGPQ